MSVSHVDDHGVLQSRAGKLEFKHVCMLGVESGDARAVLVQGLQGCAKPGISG